MKREVRLAIVLTLLSITSSPFMLLTIQRVEADSTTWYVKSDGTADFTRIQEAIDSPLVEEGDVIHVYNGTYYENVNVHKNNLTLIGESKHGTIIDGDGLGDAVIITANNVKVTGFTIRHGGWGQWESGICVESASGNNISQNILENNQAGILLMYSDKSIVTDNTAISNTYGGITLLSSSNNTVVDNYASSNEYGISLSKALYGSSHDNIVARNIAYSNKYGISLWYGSDGNSITCNNVSNSDNYGIFFFDSNFNQIVHNNFVDNTIQASCTESTNVWDEGYPSCGNYWSNYIDQDHFIGPGQDQPGYDGIWDHPCVVDYPNQDKYPLVNPWMPSWAPPIMPSEALADLIQRGAWPEHHHFVISRDEDGYQTLSARVKNLSPPGLNLNVSVEFEITRNDGFVIAISTPVAIIAPGEISTLTAGLGPLATSDEGKYYVAAKCHYNFAGDCWAAGMKARTFSFVIVS